MEELKAIKRYNWTKEQAQEFLDKCLLDVERTAPLMYKAKEIMDKLKKDGHKLFIITSRGLLTQDEVEVTIKRFKSEGLEFENVVFSVHDKASECKKLGIDVMIEDYYDYACGLAKSGIKCLYYRGSVLKQINHPKVTEVRNWGDIWVEINKMK